MRGDNSKPTPPRRERGEGSEWGGERECVRGDKRDVRGENEIKKGNMSELGHETKGKRGESEIVKWGKKME